MLIFVTEIVRTSIIFILSLPIKIIIRKWFDEHCSKANYKDYETDLETLKYIGIWKIHRTRMHKNVKRCRFKFSRDTTENSMKKILRSSMII